MTKAGYHPGEGLVWLGENVLDTMMTWCLHEVWIWGFVRGHYGKISDYF